MILGALWFNRTFCVNNKIVTTIRQLESKPFLFFFRDHLRSTLGITCGRGSFAVSGSFAVGDHLRYCTVLSLYGSYLRRNASLSCINELRSHVFYRRCCFTHFFATLKLLQELQCTYLRIFTTQKRKDSEFMKISVFFKLKY